MPDQTRPRRRWPAIGANGEGQTPRERDRKANAASRLGRAGAPLLAVLVAGIVLLATVAPTVDEPAAAAASLSVRVAENHLVSASGGTVSLHGVDRSGTEYECTGGTAIFDGPSSAASVTAIASWHANAVRIPLNEDCWLGINGFPLAYSATAYQAAIVNYVKLLNSHGLYAILDLQWTAPGTTQATGQQPMPDQDHSPAFWASVAAKFKSNPAAIFDLFNEPYPDNNTDTTAAWTCWKLGGSCGVSSQGVAYQVAGMQELVNTVRNTGATNVIMLGGVEFANALDQWAKYEPSDPSGQLAASFHTYNFTACSTRTCWNASLKGIGGAPMITGEIGENDGAGSYIGNFMGWADAHGVSYLGWTWDTWGCGAGISLITGYSGTPCPTYGSAFKHHLVVLSK
jgi:endoglucanase